MNNPVALLRKVALAEAVSYLILLGIAMPLKYGWGMPRPVQVFGTIHGVLFLVFCTALVRVVFGGRWPMSRIVAVFLASLVPLVPFLMDRRMRAWVAQWGQVPAPTPR